MYPPHPWRELSSQAIDLIGNLLQVQISLDNFNVLITLSKEKLRM